MTFEEMEFYEVSKYVKKLEVVMQEGQANFYACFYKGND